MLNHKYKIDDFEVIRTHAPISIKDKDGIFLRTETLPCYEIYILEKSIFGTKRPFVPKTRIVELKDVAEYLSIETGIDVNVILNKLNKDNQ